MEGKNNTRFEIRTDLAVEKMEDFPASKAHPLFQEQGDKETETLPMSSP